MSSASQGTPDPAGAVPTRLRVAVVQTARRRSLTETRDELLAGIDQAANRGARVVVFCEGALGGAESPAALESAMTAVRAAARARQLHVVIGVFGRNPRAGRWSNWLRPRHWAKWIRTRLLTNWMVVIGPDGQDVFRYDKIYDLHEAPMPGIFMIDGVPCSAMICADRWLRGIEEIPIQQGAKISFELSNNFLSEWIPALQWHWCVPRALRNDVWVVFANSAALRSGRSRGCLTGYGRSAVIAPGGAVIAHAPEEEDIIVADLDLTPATRSAAIARSSHPALRAFWSAGDTLQRGGHVEAPHLEALRSQACDITIAAVPVAGDTATLKSAIKAARLRGADLVVFPAGATEETEIDCLRDTARECQITVAIGAAHRVAGGVFNSAFVIGPEGSLLTRYDQLSAGAPFLAGTSPARMWFAVRGVPAIVILERDALWTELAELSAVAGARIVVHLDRAQQASTRARQTRLQVLSSLASYLTLTVAVGAGDASLWDNLRGMEQMRAENKRRPRPDTGAVEICSPWSANLVARASPPLDMLVATRAIPAAGNPHYPLRTKRYNPQMDPWYRLGASLVRAEAGTGSRSTD